MKIGVIDIGSNTIRLAIYDSETLEVVKGGVNYAGLIAYVDRNEISEEGRRILCSGVEEMRDLAIDENCEKIIAFATASLRDISDKEGLINEVLGKTGINMEIISGEKEAEYDYLGLRLRYDTKYGAAFDLGGGSAQLITFEDGMVTDYISKKIGALKLYKTFVKGNLPTKDEEEDIRNYVKGELLEFSSPLHDFAFAMGGASSAIRKLYKTLFSEDRDEFSMDELRSFLDLPENVISAIIPERLYTIKPAIIAMEEICRVLKCDRIKCVTCGVRDGVIYEYIS